ncbi:hypothetical protein [Salibacterium sp. K-3]
MTSKTQWGIKQYLSPSLYYLYNDVRAEDVISIIDIEASLLSRIGIYIILDNYSIKPSEVIQINQNLLEEYANAAYKVTTITPYVENPEKILGY